MKKATKKQLRMIRSFNTKKWLIMKLSNDQSLDFLAFIVMAIMLIAMLIMAMTWGLEPTSFIGSV